MREPMSAYEAFQLVKRLDRQIAALDAELAIARPIVAAAGYWADMTDTPDEDGGCTHLYDTVRAAETYVRTLVAAAPPTEEEAP